MNKIYKSFLALAAFLAFGALVSAQDNPYRIAFDKGVGNDKTVITDPVTGKRKIRLETFAMGGFERKAIPSDIVLVLDNSGSMLYYYLGSGDMAKYKPVLTQAEASALTSLGEPVLVPEDQHYLEAYSYTNGGPGDVGDNNPLYNSSSYKCFNDEGSSLLSAFRYARYEGKYYRLFHRTETEGSATYYYICFRLEDNSLMYLDGNGYVPASANDNHGPRTANHANTQKFQFKGVPDDPSTPEDESTLLYRAVNRMDKLVDGVNKFIDAIAANNDVIADDLGSKTGNQIAIVAFGYNTLEAHDAGYDATNTTSNSRIIKTFTPVKDASGSRVDEIKEAIGHMGFHGNTSIGLGYLLADEAFNLLRYGSTTPGDPTTGNKAMDSYEMDSEGHYLNQNGEPISGTDQPVLNRSKIVVMFTDGYTTQERLFDESVPYTYPTSGSTRYGDSRQRSIYFANLIKTSGPGQINGRIFTIGLTPSTADAAYLNHLSSNYGTNVAFNGSMTASNVNVSDYYPTDAPSTNKYYKDAGTVNLSDIFESIATEAGGSSSASSRNPINVDIVSKSFQIEDGASADNITLSIAQCLGLDPDHTYPKPNSTERKHYLAFSEPVPITDSRCSNIRLWVESTSETSGWAPENQDLSAGITVTVTPAGKITVSGFDYAKYWCGLDPDLTHDNGLLYNPADYGNFDLHTGPYIQGYRGFKLIIDIPIVLQENAIGGPKVATNEEGSGLYDPDDMSNPMIAYPIPTLTISPVNLVIKKEGLKKGENATFTILRKDANVAGAEYEPYTRMIVTGQSDASGNSVPVTVKLLNLDAGYYYKIEEDGWSWSYTKPEAPTTETVLENPIVITNTLKPGNQPKHAESVAKNQMGTAAGVGGSTTTVSTREHTIVTTP